MRRFLGSFFAGLAAIFAAERLGIPFWSSFKAGDASNLGLLVFFACFLLSPRDYEK